MLLLFFCFFCFFLFFLLLFSVFVIVYAGIYQFVNKSFVVVVVVVMFCYFDSRSACFCYSCNRGHIATLMKAVCVTDLLLLFLCCIGLMSLSQLPLCLMGILPHNGYRYTWDLVTLEQRRPCSSTICSWSVGPSPVILPALLPGLHSHPDQDFSRYIYNGLANGFHIGFDRSARIKPNYRNHPSSLDAPVVIETRISDELQQGRIIGPICPTVEVHTSPLGLVPKPHSDKFRMIVDLSSLIGFSVNDGITEDLCSLQYVSMDNAVQFITSLGQGTQLVKLDLKDVYRIFPVHPHDYLLLGIRWRDQVYVDRNLPFGLRSAPKIFSAFADMLAWCLHCQGVRFILHFLDDFLILGPPGTQEARCAMEITQQFLSSAGGR